jgi:hypothetical protein
MVKTNPNSEQRLKTLNHEGANLVAGLAIKLAETISLEESESLGQAVIRVGEAIVTLSKETDNTEEAS